MKISSALKGIFLTVGLGLVALPLLAGCAGADGADNGGTSHITESEEKMLENLNLTKTLSPREAHTVSPGDKITYTITVQNLESTAGKVNITDTVPNNTEYVDGADSVDGGALSWEIRLEAGEKREISYSVRVLDDEALCDGGVIEPTAACAAELMATAPYPLYIERTFNELDARYIGYAVDALDDSTFDNLVLAKWIYYVAYSKGLEFGETNPYTIIDMVANGIASDAILDKIAPTLYGGKRITGALNGVKGEPCEAVYEADLIPGDLIISLANDTVACYMYADTGLYSLERGCVKVDAQDLLSGLVDTDAFAVFRISSGFLYFTPTDPERTPDVLTDKQKAIVETAKYYLQRGERLQYDDTYFCMGSTSLGNESRWEAGLKSPEEFTTQNIGHSNCAAFTHDVYYSVFGEKLPSSMYTTRNLTFDSFLYDMRMYIFSRNEDDVHTDEEKARVEKEFLEALEPGDIMVIRRGSGSGHAMLYIGDGLFIHSSGSSYNYSGSYGVETYEPTVRYHRVKDYFFNEASTNGYVFGKVTSLSIVRPLANSEWASYEVTENARNRIENLKGITAEKLPSVYHGVTLNPGDEITYTFSVANDNFEEKTLDITDLIALGTEYVSGGDRVEGDKVYFKVTVPARSKVTVSYTVRVKADTEDGFEIVSNEAKISGVLFKTYSIFVKNTLTKTEEDALLSALDGLKNEGTDLRSLELVNELYKRAFGIDYDLFDVYDVQSLTEGDSGIFTSEGMGELGGKQAYRVNSDGKYFSAVAPKLFGGRRLSTPSNEDKRTHLGYPDDLKVGDLFVGRTSSAYVIFMHVGADTFLNLSTLELDGTSVAARLERGPAYSFFYAVVRPSFLLQ